jgi:hypothetical protein
MKGKLVKNNHFYALQIDSDIIAVSLDRETPEHTVNYKYSISKQNCDEIFGVVDVEKLSSDYANERFNEEYSSSTGNFQAFSSSFRDGFNKAMELNKDKLFTMEQVLDAFYAGWISKDKTYPEAQKSYKGYLERHVMQPTEIEVEVEMDRIPADLAPGGWDVFPKLDENNCLILKKVL